MIRKLSDSDTETMKEMANRLPMQKIAHLFGVSSTTVCRIINNQTYNKPQGDRYLPYNEPSVKSDVKTKRVCELVKGDVFVYFNVRWVVCSLKEGKVWYRASLPNPQGAGRYTFGGRNQMKVEIV